MNKASRVLEHFKRLKLRINISEALGKGESIDIRTATSKDRDTISKLWTEGVLYGSLNVFDTVYSDKNMGTLEHFLKDNFHLTSSQECYLGYSPKNNKFYMAWDGWNHVDAENEDDEDIRDNSSPVISFNLNDDGKVDHLQRYDEGPTIFYSGPVSMYKRLHTKVPDILDIRLD